jgi:hypothetical protein
MTILTKEQLIKDIEAMISKVADEHGMTYDELLRVWAVLEGGVVVNEEKNGG